MTLLQKAAQAVIKHWSGNPQPDDILALRKALEAEQAQAVEPIGYIRHADKTFWPHPECAVYASVSPSLAPVYAHPAPPAQLVTKPDSRPQNCGTGHCSCIECPYPKTDWSAA